ncbi:unnamed protein product [Parascedosporium putredinis]|uniref:Uncharacterized protein n=1 Tax=Parascedosporium putredinis TaxID=1442378 RepID=A0A9P1GW41_9PEZI|nr:unnamed protein product [Parascedosporium putredinis]CAI7988470.1 unnamed protein product [Parascedosporium putredinis]
MSATMDPTSFSSRRQATTSLPQFHLPAPGEIPMYLLLRAEAASQQVVVWASAKGQAGQDTGAMEPRLAPVPPALPVESCFQFALSGTPTAERHPKLAKFSEPSTASLYLAHPS